MSLTPAQRDYAHRGLQHSDSSAGRHDLPRVARGQVMMIVSVALAYGVPYMLSFMQVANPELAGDSMATGGVIMMLRLLSYAGSVAIAGAGVFTVGKGLRWHLSLGTLCAGFMLLPFLNLIVLAVVNRAATVALRAGGWRVGLVGAQPPR